MLYMMMSVFHGHTHACLASLPPTLIPSGADVHGRDCVAASAGPASGKCFLPLLGDHFSGSVGTVSWLNVWIP